MFNKNLRICSTFNVKHSVDCMTNIKSLFDMMEVMDEITLHDNFDSLDDIYDGETTLYQYNSRGNRDEEFYYLRNHEPFSFFIPIQDLMRFSEVDSKKFYRYIKPESLAKYLCDAVNPLTLSNLTNEDIKEMLINSEFTTFSDKLYSGRFTLFPTKSILSHNINTCYMRVNFKGGDLTVSLTNNNVEICNRNTELENRIYSYEEMLNEFLTNNDFNKLFLTKEFNNEICKLIILGCNYSSLDNIINLLNENQLFLLIKVGLYRLDTDNTASFLIKLLSDFSKNNKHVELQDTIISLLTEKLLIQPVDDSSRDYYIAKSSDIRKYALYINNLFLEYPDKCYKIITNEIISIAPKAYKTYGIGEFWKSFFSILVETDINSILENIRIMIRCSVNHDKKYSMYLIQNMIAYLIEEYDIQYFINDDLICNMFISIDYFINLVNTDELKQVIYKKDLYMLYKDFTIFKNDDVLDCNSAMFISNFNREILVEDLDYANYYRIENKIKSSSIFNNTNNKRISFLLFLASNSDYVECKKVSYLNSDGSIEVMATTEQTIKMVEATFQFNYIKYKIENNKLSDKDKVFLNVKFNKIFKDLKLMEFLEMFEYFIYNIFDLNNEYDCMLLAKFKYCLDSKIDYDDIDMTQPIENIINTIKIKEFEKHMRE